MRCFHHQGDARRSISDVCILVDPSINPMELQHKSGLGHLCWGSITIMFYGVKLASRLTPVNFGGPMIFCWGFTPLAKCSSFKALKTRPPSHSHLLHNPLCIVPGPPQGGWEYGFAGRACRLNIHVYWYQHAPPEPYQPSVQLIVRYYPKIRLEGLRNTMKNLGQDSRSPGRDLKPGSPEYKLLDHDFRLPARNMFIRNKEDLYRRSKTVRVWKYWTTKR
jgi:hypothetical protein